MDHSMSMSMTMTTTANAAAASSTGMSMGGMGGMGGVCKISMLWNWYTIDACFLARSWRITSKSVFAGSCIGVILLVLVLEALRRASAEYDAFLVRKHIETQSATATRSGSDSDTSLNKGPGAAVTPAACTPIQLTQFRPNALQQAIRASLHMCQFAVAYFIMLLAMYYNGYIIICIFIGAFLGFFIFSWKSLGGSSSAQQREVTFCCG